MARTKGPSRKSVTVGLSEGVYAAAEEARWAKRMTFSEFVNHAVGRFLATEGIPATGYSLCYELGIFRQRIVDGRQTEVADNWRTAASSWLVPCHEDTVEVRFGGRVEPHWDAYGHYHGELRGYESVLAVPRDMLIARPHAVLARAGFGNHARFAHVTREQGLSNHIIDFMRAGVVQLFALEINLCAAKFRF